MHASALVLLIVLAQGCMHPAAFIGSSTTDTLASCRANDSCGGGSDDSDIAVPIVLGAVAVGAIALAMHRYVQSMH